jgi:asparagine synthase (glutamine-hydrolysing)
MCGFVGMVLRRDRLDSARLESARDVLRHRGPDGAGLWVSTQSGPWCATFAHRRLSILDLSEHGDQPLLRTGRAPSRPAVPNEVGGATLALVYNGEIYNYVELRDELAALGHAFTSSGDTEVLLAAYAEWGESCLTRLNGMFAFAIWDGTRRRLFGARDRFGEKPLHYVFDKRSELFAFASEVKALFALGVAAPQLDDRSVYRYFRFGEQAGVESTIWRDVRRLLPATAFTVDVGDDGPAMRTWRYWDVDFDGVVDIPLARSAERFRELFADSVRLRLRSDVRVGTSLSGGLDSSSVLCQVSAIGASAGQAAFTARMDDPMLDEGRHVDVLLSRTRIPGFSVTPTAAEFLEELDKLFYHQEEPFPSTSIFASYLVNRLAFENGVTVLLDGQGADEYLAGYPHYPAVRLTDLARRGRLIQWWLERRASAERLAIDPVPPRAVFALVGSSVRGEHRVIVDDVHPVGWLQASFRERFASEEPRAIPTGPDALRTRLYADLMLGHLQELLRYADRNGMAFSREPRLPFLDHRLVEFCATLPTTHLLSRGVSKRVLRKAMRGVVPDAILDRKDKVGFATPWTQWWTGPHGPALTSRFLDCGLLLRDFVDVSKIVPGSRESLIVITLASALEALAPVARSTAA